MSRYDYHTGTDNRLRGKAADEVQELMDTIKQRGLYEPSEGRLAHYHWRIRAATSNDEIRSLLDGARDDAARATDSKPYSAWTDPRYRY